MKGLRAARVVIVLFSALALSFLVYVFFFLEKKSSPAVAASSTMIPLTPAGRAVQAAHPGWDNTACNAVAERRLRIGMRKEMVRAAWGDPHMILRRADARAEGIAAETLSTKEEEWILGHGPHPRRVIFRNFIGHSQPDNTAKVIFFQDSIVFRASK